MNMQRYKCNTVSKECVMSMIGVNFALAALHPATSKNIEVFIFYEFIKLVWIALCQQSQPVKWMFKITSNFLFSRSTHSSTNLWVTWQGVFFPINMFFYDIIQIYSFRLQMAVVMIETYLFLNMYQTSYPSTGITSPTGWTYVISYQVYGVFA